MLKNGVCVYMYVPEAVRPEIPNTKSSGMNHQNRCCLATIDPPPLEALIHWKNWNGNDNIVHQ